MRRALSFLLSAAKLAPIPIGLFLAAYFVLLESYAAGPLASVGLALAAACLCLYAGADACYLSDAIEPEVRATLAGEG